MWNEVPDGAAGLQLVKRLQHRLTTVTILRIFHHEKHQLALTSFCARPLQSTMSNAVDLF